MKFTSDRTALADACAIAARTAPIRSELPVLSGARVQVDDARVSVSAFDYNTSASASTDVTDSEPGGALVPARLLADITRGMPPGEQVTVALEGTALRLTCGRAVFTLPTLPLEDYPTLPALPSAVGRVDGARLAAAVARTAFAASRDRTLPAIGFVQVLLSPSTITLRATDRWRFATTSIPWDGRADVDIDLRIQADTLSEVAKTFVAHDEVTLAASDDAPLAGFCAAGREVTTRLSAEPFPSIQAVYPSEFVRYVDVDTGTLVAAIKRASLVAEAATPVRLDITPAEITVNSGTGDEARATETLPGVLTGDPCRVAFNPRWLMDGLTAIGSETTVRLRFAPMPDDKPQADQADGDLPLHTRLVVLADATGDPTTPDTYEYLLMPVRLQG